MTNKLSGINDAQLQIFNLNIKDLNPSEYNPRKWDKYKIEQQNITTENKPLKFHEYFKHIVINGSDDEKAELLGCIKQTLYIHNGEIFANPLI